MSRLPKNLISGVTAYADLIKQLNIQCPLHANQIVDLQELFVKKKRYVMLNCGRNYGKTYEGIYFLIRRAIEMPGTVWYYICPTEKQAQETIWDTHRLIQAIPEQAIKSGKEGKKETDLAIHFKNGSSIYLKGSNQDPQSKRGIKMDGVVYDEFRDFSPKFHEAFAKNFVKPHFQLLILSTPPSLEEIKNGTKKFYKEMMDSCETEPDCALVRRPSYDNPHVCDWALREKAILLRQGRVAEYEREIEALIVPGVYESLFPDIGFSCLKPHIDVLRRLEKTGNDKRYVVTIDPSGLKRWGALFSCVDFDTSSVSCLDCIVLSGTNPDEKEQMSPQCFWALIAEKMKELQPNLSYNDWMKIYDSAQPGFANDVNIHIDKTLNFFPVNKKNLSRMDGFGVIRDLNKAGRLFISERCQELINEFSSLELATTGELPKKEYDELIDCLRYCVMEYDHVLAVKEPLKNDLTPRKSGEKILDMVEKLKQSDQVSFEDLFKDEYDVGDYLYD